MAIVIPGRGYKSYVQFDIESAFGTPVAAAKKIYVTKFKIHDDQSVIKSESLDGSLDLSYVAQGKQLFGFSLSVEWMYAGLERFTKWLLGANASGAGPPYTHTATGGADPMSGTFEFIDGDIPTGKCYQMAGCLMKSAKWNVKSGGILTCDVEALAVGCISDATPTGALVFPTFDPVLAGHASAIVDGSGVAIASARHKEFSLDFKLDLDDDRSYLSSFGVDQPLPKAKRDTVYTYDQEYISKAAYDAVKAATSAACSITFTNSAKVFKLEAPASMPSKYEDGPDGFGIVRARTTYEAYGNGTFQIKASTTNASAAI